LTRRLCWSGAPSFATAWAESRGPPMGAWGLGSDENDTTYDSVGFGIFERLQGVALTEEGKVSLTAELQAERPAALNEPGVVVLLIKLGCTLDQDTIRAAVTALDAELISDANSSGWSDVEGRKAVVRHEILLLEAALKSGNKLPGDPIGARGITTGGTQPDAHLKHTREDESSDDSDSDPDDGPESDNSGEYGYSAEEKLTTHLRFRVGDRVEAKRQSPLGPVWFSTGRVTACFQLIEQGDAFGDTMIGRFSAYAIELDCDDSKVWAPRDHDRYVRKGSSEKPAPAALREEAMSLGYDVSDMDDVEVPPHTPWYAPLRFTVGQKVLANGQTGTITQQWYREERSSRRALPPGRLVCVSDLAG
jgi:hypothetical protein